MIFELEKLTALQDTMLVVRPQQSVKLLAEGLPNRVYKVPAGTALSCVDLDWWEGDAKAEHTDGDDYYWLQLAEALPGSPVLNWFAWANHWQAQHPQVVDQPVFVSDADKKTAAGLIKSASNAAMAEAPSAARVEDLGPTIQLPGAAFKRPRHLKEPIFWLDGKPCPFTWAEMTANGDRIPATEQIASNIVRVTKLLTAMRKAFDQPIGITSGYRPVRVNAAIGGARYSRHTDPHGDAVDWYPMNDGITREGWDLVCKIQQGGGLAISGADNNPGVGFFHSDCRGDGDPLNDQRGRTFWTYPKSPSWVYDR